MEWIKCEDQMPDEYEDVIVYNDCGAVISDYWYPDTFEGETVVAWTHSCHNVTHWMPLPDPPKED